METTYDDHEIEESWSQTWPFVNSCAEWATPLEYQGDARSRSKGATWVSRLYGVLILEFDRLRSAGIKLSPPILRNVAISLIAEAEKGIPIIGHT